MLRLYRHKEGGIYVRLNNKSYKDPVTRKWRAIVEYLSTDTGEVYLREIDQFSEDFTPIKIEDNNVIELEKTNIS